MNHISCLIALFGLATDHKCVFTIASETVISVKCFAVKTADFTLTCVTSYSKQSPSERKLMRLTARPHILNYQYLCVYPNYKL